MGKRGNPNLNKDAEQKKERATSLIRQAVKSLEQNHEIKSIPAVSAKTKELDPAGKGLSEASFRNKELEHIQSLMLELRIGKYEGLSVATAEKDTDIADQLLQAKKELEKKDKEIKKLKQNKKQLNEKINVLFIENEELRTAMYEVEMKFRISNPFKVANNKI
ncbi:MAG: hypothetical protein Q8O20_00275 [Sulfuricurvum sp.]|uniref:hypothetical protein n=1 Tax=Sulfuricurvum sp. TaxID=2025608 RepID=UPI0027368900|nr:hypothetical protein [Sulfuricurvum sp.]MDP2849486.1 hypothetical protein [Sulfuricurvum sp.]